MRGPQVVNLREVNLRDPDVVRIDRLSAWGNPYVIGPDGNRAQVIEAYRGWISERADLLERLGELEGKRLACWCAPRACHGDVLAELVAERLELPEEPVGTGKPCARCNSRHGTVTGLEVCLHCARDLGLTVAQEGNAGEPVEPSAEGWGWMLSPCPECGRPTVHEPRCSWCRLRADLELRPRVGPTPGIEARRTRSCADCGGDTGHPGAVLCRDCAHERTYRPRP